MKFEEYLANQMNDPEYAATERKQRPLLDLANEVLGLRLARGWSQSELARRAGVREDDISRIESGLIGLTVQLLQNIARAFDADVEIALVPLEKEFEYYLENQDSLVEKYNGKIVVIKGCSVIGVFDSEIEAIKKTAKEQELGTFLVQRCVPGSDSYTQAYTSRITFPPILRERLTHVRKEMECLEETSPNPTFSPA